MRIIPLFIAFISFNLSAQVAEAKWTAKPFDKIGFVENLGQIEPLFNQEIIFFARAGATTYFLTTGGIIVGQQEVFSGTELWERHEDFEKGEQIEPAEWHYFFLKWENSSATAKFVPVALNKHTFHFQNPTNLKETIKAKTYSELVLESIYDGIDLQFYLPEEGGLKYSFIVHPGKNAEQINFSFQQAETLINASGEIEIQTEMPLFLDKAPKAWVEGGEEVKVAFKEDNSQKYGFKLGDYNKTKTLVIDPWVVLGLPFTDTQQGYDVGADFVGNVSVLGQHGNEVAHYDNTGALDWVWTSPGSLNQFYGDMDVNPYNGDTYYMFMGLFMGVQDIWRLNVSGVVTASIYLIPAEDDPGELWRIRYNRVTDEVVVGAGGLPRASHLLVLDGDLTTKAVYAPLTPFPPNLTDATLLDVDPLGEYFYFLCSGDAPPLYNNTIYKVLQSDPSVIVWESSTAYTFQEISCIGYMGYEVMTGEGPDWYSANGMNGMACSFDLYTYDGDNLDRWDRATGDLLGTRSITPLDPTIYGDLVFCGGIDTDPCGNVYLGTEDSLLKFTRELDFMEGYELPDTCYDVRFTMEGLFASGKDFVQAWDDYDWVSLTMSSTDQPCGSCDGTATIYPESFCPELVPSVVWSPSGQTDFTATGLCIGWHTATVSWINEIGDTLVIVDSVEVELGAAGTLNLDVSDQTCNEDCDGSVIITVTGGFDPFVFEVGPESNGTGIFTELCEGIYPIVVTDNDGCLFIDTVVINALDSIVVDEMILHEACEDACNGSVTLMPTTGLAPYSYTLGVETNATGVFEDLCAGIYEVLVIDANSCAYYNVIEIIVGEDLGLDTVSANAPSCYGFTDGSATVSTLIGEEPITYTWFPTNPVPGATYNNLAGGTYTVVALDANGCYDTLVFDLFKPDSLYASLNLYDPLCYGDSTGSVGVDTVYNAQGDLDNISFIWSPDPSNVSGVGADSSYQLYSGTYALSITDDKGCSWVTDFSISEPEPLVFAEFGYDPAYCRLFDYQNGNGVVFAAATGGTPDYTYEWLNLETLESTVNSTWGGLNPGTYQITVIDENGCVLQDIIEMDSLNPIADFTINSAQLDGAYEGTEVVLATFENKSQNFANPNNPLADTTFFWNLDNPNAEWFISHDYFEDIDSNYRGEATYDICLVAINSNGCADTLCKTIIVHVQPEFIAPNIFTPDGDGKNDVFTFEFKAQGIETFSCQIVNRWGIVVAELDDIAQGWDGTTFSGTPCVSGTYFYSYSAKSTNGTDFIGQGTVQLVR